jgi:TonB-dependent receptor
MKNTPSHRAGALSTRSSLFKLAPIAAGCAVLVMTTSGAYAQDAALSTVTVTGIRKGIEDAISVKKNSNSIVESISAEDIGKLPDNSIAESIARLPGLSAQRVAGRAQVISVRGLSPDFATTLLNGREIVSTGDNRSVEFDQYPSELLSGVTVYKTPDAGLIGQGLSGTMDMQSVRPLNFKNRVFSIGARGTQNSLGDAANAKATGNRVSVSYIDQFADRTLGLALGFAHQETPIAENQVGLYEPWEIASRPGVAAGSYIMDGIKALRRTGVTKRDGLMATVEWKPSRDWTSTLDMFTSKATQVDTANQWETHLYYNGDYPCQPACQWTGANTNANGTLTGGKVTNIYPLVRGMYNNREDKIDAFGWNNKFKLGEVAVTVDANYSKAKRNETTLENNTQLVPAKQFDTAILNFQTGGFPTMAPTLNYSDPTKLFLRGTIYGSGYGRVPSVEDELKAFKVNGSFPVPEMLGSLFSDIEVGLNYSDRSKEKHQPEGNINVGAQGDTTIASDLQYGNIDLSFAGLRSIPSWNVPGAVARYMTFNPSETSAGYLINKAWLVKEKITTTHAKANIEAQWGSVSVRGNVGVQMQSIDQSSSANYYDDSAPEGKKVKPIIDGKTYNEVLPSMNLAFGIGSDQTVRMGLAQQVARPKMQDLAASVDFGVNEATGKPGASGGNPNLDPWRADAFDVSYEKYFGTKAYVSAAAFYKNLNSYIYKQSRDNFDLSKYTPGSKATTNFGSFSAPFNGQGGKLSGLELAVSVPFNLLTPALNGFGIQASTSITNSNILIKDPDSSSSVGNAEISLPGLSKNVTNVTVYYEVGGFEARVSQRTRSDFIGEIGNFNGNRTLRYVVGESVVDAQIGYNFKEGSLKGLGLLLQVNNLGDTAYQTYAGSKDRPLETIKYGSTVLFGANYKF